MSTTQLYSDEVKADVDHDFVITTTVWGRAKDCQLFCDEIKKKVENNRGVLGGNFAGFHGVNLNARNWRRISVPYIQVLQTLFSFLNTGHLRMLVFLESANKRSSNSIFLEDTLKKHITDKGDPFGRIFQYISTDNLSAIYKSADKIYNYLRNRKHFGGKYQRFEYFPDASGNILHYKDRMCSFQPPGTFQTPLMMPFYELVVRITNALSRILAKGEWGRQDHQELIRFSPCDDKESYLIQSADLVSNFMLNLVKYLSGLKPADTEKKAKVLLGFDAFRRNREKIRQAFAKDAEKCLCADPKLEASLIMEKEPTKFAERFIIT